MGTRFTTFFALTGGGKRDRTADLLHAMQALSQLSYTPQVLKTNQTWHSDIYPQCVNSEEARLCTYLRVYASRTPFQVLIAACLLNHPLPV